MINFDVDHQDHWHSCRRRITAASLLLMLVVLCAPLNAQVDLPDANLSIVFLNSVSARASGPTAVDENALASSLRVSPSDARAVVAAARSFAAEESRLRSEAIAYTKGQDLAKAPHDTGMIRAFTARRAALAQEAIATLRSGLSREGADVILRHLAQLRQSIVVWK